MRRHQNTKGYINWPKTRKQGVRPMKGPGEDLIDTMEGGMECWLILPWQYTDSVCIAGVNFLLFADVIVSDHKTLTKAHRGEFKSIEPSFGQSFNLALLISSTGQSIWNEKTQEYWKAHKQDLNEKGVALFSMLTELYGREPELMTALDT